MSLLASLIITNTVLYLTGGSPLDGTMVHRLIEQYSLMTMAVVTLNNCCLACLNYITRSSKHWTDNCTGLTVISSEVITKLYVLS